jgi:NAD(P)-dependent dehydrogenase (short-subunit alcohol dehydrogenase family)
MMYPLKQDLPSATNTAVLNTTFSVNTIGPLSLRQALLPNILKSSSPRIGNMSSRVGSVGDNNSGGSYAYRASKAALNSISRSMAMDLKLEGVLVVIMHPGYVKTGLSPWDHDLPEAVEPDGASSNLWKVLMSKSIGETGRFWYREGQGLTW